MKLNKVPMKLEIWTNNKKTLILYPEKWGDYYLEFNNGTYYMSGITRYWLINNGFKQVENEVK